MGHPYLHLIMSKQHNQIALSLFHVSYRVCVVGVLLFQFWGGWQWFGSIVLNTLLPPSRPQQPVNSSFWGLQLLLAGGPKKFAKKLKKSFRSGWPISVHGLGQRSPRMGGMLCRALVRTHTTPLPFTWGGGWAVPCLAWPGPYAIFT